MQEGRIERNLALLQRVSDEELQLAEWLTNDILEYSNSRFSKLFTGRHCLTRALLRLRGIQAMKTEPSRAKILELGLGSGYLSLLLAKTGYAVDTVEVAQAFALHQSLFFHHFMPKSSPSESWTHQVPGWTYASDSEHPHAYDIITANHALAEFHPESLDFLLRRYGKQHMEQFGYSPIIVSESLGFSARPYENVLRHFHQRGWISETKNEFYIFRYDPVSAAQRRQEDLRAQVYQQSLRRKIKKSGYLFLHRWKRRVKVEQSRKNEHSSIAMLRDVFEQLIPFEQTPDESFYRVGGKLT